MSIQLYGTSNPAKAAELAVLNRPWNQMLAQSGLAEDGSNFSGFATAASVTAKLDTYTFRGGEVGVVNTQYPVGDVRRYGAMVDDATNDALAFQRAVDAASATGYGLVIVPPGGVRLGTTITLPSNVTVVGAGKDVTIIRDHSSLGANPLFRAHGTVGSRISNIAMRDLTLRNGTASAGSYTVGKDGVSVQYCDGFSFWNVKTTEIQGVFGLRPQYSTKISALHSDWYRCTYSMLSVGIECENILVQHCSFDTLTSLTEPNTYTFSTGGSALGVGAYFCKNVWLLDNKFLNNPRWEGIDFHGVENAWIERNYVENCKAGLLLAVASGYVAAPTIKNVWVRDNIFIQGTGVTNQHGLIIQGSDDGSVYAENVNLSNNKVVGFGGTASTSSGSLFASFVRGLRIEGGRFDDYNMAAIMLSTGVEDVRIRNVGFGNCANPGFSANAGCINFRSTGVYGVIVEGCFNTATDPAKLPNLFAYAAGSSLNVQFINNRYGKTTVGVFGNVGFMPVEKASVPTTNLTLKYGDVVMNTLGKPGWVASAIGTGKAGYGSLDTAVVTTVNATAGSALVPIAGAATDFRLIPRGMAVSIAGAGVAGAALTALVLDVIVTATTWTLVLDTAASTTVAGANLTYQSVTLTSASIDMRVSADNGDANKTIFANTNEPTQLWATTLTANRSISLGTAGAQNGDRFRIVRTGLGAFTLAVGALKTIPAGTAAFVDVAYNGSAWILVGYGLL